MSGRIQLTPKEACRHLEQSVSPGSNEVVVRQKLHLKVIILSEIPEEIVGQRLDIMNPRIDQNRFVTAKTARWANIGRIGHSMIGPEGRHDAAQAVGPIAGAEGSTIAGATHYHEVIDFRIHAD